MKERDPEGKLVIDISVGHGNKEGYQGTESACGLSEWWIGHYWLRPALEKAFKDHERIKLRFWDAQDHPEWRQRDKKSGLLLYDRLEAMYRKNTQPPVQLALALHNNASKNTKYGGHMHIYRQDVGGNSPEARQSACERSKRLAELLSEAYASQIVGMKARGAKADRGDWVSRNLAFTRWAKRRGAVGVIIEFGFLTHEPDVDILYKDDTPHKAAAAIRLALRTFLAERNVL